MNVFWLNFQPEGLAGYAYHVLSMILDPRVDRKSADFTYAIDHLFAVPVARDSLLKYCCNFQLKLFSNHMKVFSLLSSSPRRRVHFKFTWMFVGIRIDVRYCVGLL